MVNHTQYADCCQNNTCSMRVRAAASSASRRALVSLSRCGCAALGSRGSRAVLVRFGASCSCCLASCRHTDRTPMTQDVNIRLLRKSYSHTDRTCLTTVWRVSRLLREIQKHQSEKVQKDYPGCMEHGVTPVLSEEVGRICKLLL